MRSSGEVARDWVRAIERSRALQADGTLAAVVTRVAAERGDAAALTGEGETYTYRALADRVAHWCAWAGEQGFAAGDAVALLMPNRPEYLAIWLGLSHAGVTVALLNTNLSAEALDHCMRAADARHVIVDERLAGRCPAPRERTVVLSTPVVRGEGDDCPLPGCRGSAPALFIYTSGTTGLPKATNISHARTLEWSGWFAGMMDATAEDRLYDCLPLYHSTGGVVAVGAMLSSGGSVVLRERFSASRFWPDIAATGCTIFQYIGELCRYLLSSAADTPAHSLRLACGNGLSGAVWPAFQDRFAIPRILEFYAATEGGISLYNCEGKPGAIGRIPSFLQHRFPLALLQTDPDTNEPVRDADGRCIPGDTGELVAKLGETVRFEGYTDPAASTRKLLTGVREPGDRWFRTGDLMRRDERGFFFFLDRLGDTFRWKGENVSTTEVAAALLRCPGVVDAAVFGVAVTGAEGRAGMAALVTDEQFGLEAFAAHVEATLPSYARPLYVRLCASLDLTGTFKLSKAGLAREGYEGSPDPVFVLTAGRYMPAAAANPSTMRPATPGPVQT
jgi:fatty-acyl-CoA synthase